ncbi:PorT family protein [Aquimarina brevivitae]|uniref:Outer membrane protein with beta-barrel domain n=1 Tax=Aquimarina brevivitae TaxID=323412 RepID=A0A4Q7NYT0_9FLAO|nr:PorT family protein [Aquimarina brevivitae]RZS92200.1 hypothetical protein EV197_2836 [Aquimarina brevivitae]
MKKIMLAAFAALVCSLQIFAQDSTVQDKVGQLEKQRTELINIEKEALRKEVEEINERLIKEEISLEEATKLKEEAAKKHALNIENASAIIDNKIALLERNKGQDITETNSQLIVGIGAIDEDGENVIFGINIKDGESIKKEVKYDRRTYSDLVIAFGLNNALFEDQSLNDSPYKIAGSRFFEIGYAWNTRVFNNSNFLRIKYGFSFQFNGLKPTDNRYFVENGNITELQDFPINLDKSKFRMDNLVVPIHFEIGPSKVRKTEEKIRYSTHKQFRLGVGGYVGANLSTRQKLKFEENGGEVKDKIKRDYNTNDLIYGLSGYAGFGDMTVYLKYDLNPIFRSPNIEQNNVSLGLRFDL